MSPTKALTGTLSMCFGPGASGWPFAVGGGPSDAFPAECAAVGDHGVPCGSVSRARSMEWIACVQRRDKMSPVADGAATDASSEKLACRTSPGSAPGCELSERPLMWGSKAGPCVAEDPLATGSVEHSAQQNHGIRLAAERKACYEPPFQRDTMVIGGPSLHPGCRRRGHSVSARPSWRRGRSNLSSCQPAPPCLRHPPVYQRQSSHEPPR